MAYLENGKAYSGRIIIRPGSGGNLAIIRKVMESSGWEATATSPIVQSWGKVDATNAWFKSIKWLGPSGENTLEYSYSTSSPFGNLVENFYVSDLLDKDGNVLQNEPAERWQFEKTSDGATVEQRDVDVDMSQVRREAQADASSESHSGLWLGLGVLGVGAALLMWPRR